MDTSNRQKVSPVVQLLLEGKIDCDFLTKHDAASVLKGIITILKPQLDHITPLRIDDFLKHHCYENAEECFNSSRVKKDTRVLVLISRSDYYLLCDRQGQIIQVEKSYGAWGSRSTAKLASLKIIPENKFSKYLEGSTYEPLDIAKNLCETLKTEVEIRAGRLENLQKLQKEMENISSKLK